MVTQAELDAAVAAARTAIDATGYGGWVSDEVLTAIVVKSLQAASEARAQQRERPS